jgi:hypothetical protein
MRVFLLVLASFSSFYSSAQTASSIDLLNFLFLNPLKFWLSFSHQLEKVYFALKES